MNWYEASVDKCTNNNNRLVNNSRTLLTNYAVENVCLTALEVV